ncbi:bifunctional phosphoribosyl-AMP cyclohydrolase/phosphoribosyl-ATP diphosphatase HisIE [Sulfobacillus harzensis]|uniref:bifunctional phosphoribosyl-AMP cyclohydrolase/phosphoribosyl-ATP diphosphatase HisIE n=1 Tax=Sulfobacillus harzensis TaxID=2729629 RepID=UPI001A9BC955
MQLIENGRVLYPVVVQDYNTRAVLMVAFADQEALSLSEHTGWAHFFSRSRQQLWLKGETSGHRLKMRAMLTDCDQDAWLYQVEPLGPVCHRLTPGCFDVEGADADPLHYVIGRVKERLRTGPQPASYTWRLLNQGTERVAQKVGEEGLEVALAAQALTYEEGAEKRAMLAGEIADLLYHLAVLAEKLNIDWHDVSAVLQARAKENSKDVHQRESAE